MSPHFPQVLGRPPLSSPVTGTKHQRNLGLGLALCFCQALSSKGLRGREGWGGVGLWRVGAAHDSLEAEGKVSGKTLQKRHVSGRPSPAVAAGPRLPQWPQCSPRWSPLWCTARHHHSRHSTHRTWPSHGGPLRTTAPSGGLPHLGGVQESQGSRQSFKMGWGVSAACYRVAAQ